MTELIKLYIDKAPVKQSSPRRLLTVCTTKKPHVTWKNCLLMLAIWW